MVSIPFQREKLGNFGNCQAFEREYLEEPKLSLTRPEKAKRCQKLAKRIRSKNGAVFGSCSDFAIEIYKFMAYSSASH